MNNNQNFCYWRLNTPLNFPLQQQNICLLKQSEYKILNEMKMEEQKRKINIFCPYINTEQAMECNDYILIKDIKWDKS